MTLNELLRKISPAYRDLPLCIATQFHDSEVIDAVVLGDEYSDPNSEMIEGRHVVLRDR